MADYFTNFSLVLNLASEAEQADAFDLADKACLAQQGDELPAEFPKTLVEGIEDWSFETVPKLLAPNAEYGCTPCTGCGCGVRIHPTPAPEIRSAGQSNL